MKILITFILPFFLIAVCNHDNFKDKNENISAVRASNDSMLFESGYSEVNGIKMYYEIHGNDGDNLVLIHGGGSTIATTFGRIIPLLAGDFKVIALELQAHGHTSDRNTPESFEQDADDVAGLLQNLHIPKASFFGFSNGGNTAMQVAIRHPELLNKLIIASAFYKREGMFPGFFDMMQKGTINDMPRALKTAFLQINPDSARLMNMFNKDRERMLQFKDWEDGALRSIRAPALIICGDRDVVLPAHALAMSGLIGKSRLMILPAMHGSYIGVEELQGPESKLPDMTVEIIREFLRE